MYGFGQKVRFGIVFKIDGLNRELMTDYFKKNNLEVLGWDDHLEPPFDDDPITIVGLECDGFFIPVSIKFELNLKEDPRHKYLYYPMA